MVFPRDLFPGADKVAKAGDTMTGQLVVPAGGLFVQAQNATTEGGEIYLARGPTSTLAGNVIVDVIDQSVRFFEIGGGTRGAYLDLAACAGGANQPILRPSQVGQTGKFLRTGGTINSELWDDPGLDHYECNGAFQVWQHANPAGYVQTDAVGAGPCDLWSAYHTGGAANFTWSRVLVNGTNGLTGYAVRCQRTAGSTFANNIWFYHDMEWKDVLRYRGKTVTVSIYIQVGIDFSNAAGGIGFQVYTGTGTTDVNRIFAAYPSGDTLTVNSGTGALTPAGAFVRFSWTYTVPYNASQMCFLFYRPTAGTAGGADFVDYAGFQLDVGSYAQPFRARNLATVLGSCQRRYFKSFPYTTVPAQATGNVNGAYMWPAIGAGAVVSRGGHFPFPVTMRAAPTVTSFNPISANANARDFTNGLDCSAIAIGSAEDSVWFSDTGNAGTTNGARLIVHFTADARF